MMFLDYLDRGISNFSFPFPIEYKSFHFILRRYSEPAHSISKRWFIIAGCTQHCILDSNAMSCERILTDNHVQRSGGTIRLLDASNNIQKSWYIETLRSNSLRRTINKYVPLSNIENCIRYWCRVFFFDFLKFTNKIHK